MKSLSLLILCGIILSSCSLFNNEDDGYEQALEKWENQKFPHYEFSYQMSCFCPKVTPAIVVVSSDSVYQILDPDTRDSLMIETGEGTFEYAGDLYPTFYRTIDGLFGIIKEARQEAYKFNADYDSEFGYPVNIGIDYYKDAVDDEIGYTISNYFAYRITTHD